VGLFYNAPEPIRGADDQGFDLQTILRQSYDWIILPKSRSTYDERILYQTSYEERRANSQVRFTCKIARNHALDGSPRRRRVADTKDRSLWRRRCGLTPPLLELLVATQMKPARVNL